MWHCGLFGNQIWCILPSVCQATQIIGIWFLKGHTALRNCDIYYGINISKLMKVPERCHAAVIQWWYYTSIDYMTCLNCNNRHLKFAQLFKWSDPWSWQVSSLTESLCGSLTSKVLCQPLALEWCSLCWWDCISLPLDFLAYPQKFASCVSDKIPVHLFLKSPINQKLWNWL